MIFPDRYGLPLTTTSEAAAEAFVDGVGLLLSYNLGTADRFSTALAADDDFAMAHLALGLYLQVMDPGRSRQEFDRAYELAKSASSREQSLIRAIADPNLSGRMGSFASLPLLDAHMDNFPRDFLAANRFTQILHFSGLKDAYQRALGRLEAIKAHLRDDWAFLAAHAFLLEEGGRFGEAERMVNHSLELNPRNGVAAHVVSHISFENGRHDEGTSWLTQWLDEHGHQSGLFCHLSWHLALFELARGHYQAATALYERRILPAPVTPSSLADATSFLWRVMLYDCADRELSWEPVALSANRVASSPNVGFFAAHAALWAAVQPDGPSRIAAMCEALSEIDSEGDPIAVALVRPLVRGLEAFVCGDFEAASALLGPLTADLHRLGGSHAQREVFEDTLLVSYIRSRRYEQATIMLNERLSRRESARDLSWLAEVQEAQGKSAIGSRTARRAKLLWAAADSTNPEQARLDRLAASDAGISTGS